MSSSVFLVGADNSLTELKRSSYESEDLLQRLLADHPAFLSSALGANGGLLLIRREQSVPDEMTGAGRWSLDHLFVDREGVPVLVEVKRASDTRARREVVAQMLDYAANGVAYWPVEGIIDAFSTTVTNSGADPDKVISEFLGGDDPEAFWKRVDANLRSGRVRMVFLADSVGKELRRIVEFLNEQMRPAEVWAVEVIQYVNESGIRTLVPTRLGATERAQSAKALVTQRMPMDLADWFNALAAQHGNEAQAGANRMLDWYRDRDLNFRVADSRDSVTTAIRLPTGRQIVPFFLRRSTANFEFSLQNLKSVDLYSSDEARIALLQRIKQAFPTLRIATTLPTGWPSIPLAALVRDEVWAAACNLTEEILHGCQANS